MAVVSFDLERGKDELRPLTSGGSFENIYQLLYYVALLKYATQEQIKSIGFAGAEKLATKKKLQALSELGYLHFANQSEKPYIIPDAFLVLKEERRYQLNFLEIEAEKPNCRFFTAKPARTFSVSAAWTTRDISTPWSVCSIRC